MGLWGKFSSFGKNRPNAPAPQPYQKNPSLEGGFAGRLEVSDEATYQAMMRNLQREPGYAEKDIKAMEDMPADAQKVQEKGALRQLNQNAAATGRFGSGGTQAGRGGILSSGMTTRASIRQNARIEAARAALADRYEQIAMAERFTQGRHGLMADEYRNRNAYQSSVNDYNLRKWGGETALQEADLAAGGKILMPMASMMAGGGGPTGAPSPGGG